MIYNNNPKSSTVSKTAIKMSEKLSYFLFLEQKTYFENFTVQSSEMLSKFLFTRL